MRPASKTERDEKITLAGLGWIALCSILSCGAVIVAAVMILKWWGAG